MGSALQACAEPYLLSARAAALCAALEAYGGVVTGDGLSHLMTGSVEQPISTVARLLIARKVVWFQAHGQTLIPMFQFHVPDYVVRTTVRSILVELTDAFDDIEIAEWFVTPSLLLKGEVPVAVLDRCGTSIIDAARADRFVALG